MDVITIRYQGLPYRCPLCETTYEHCQPYRDSKDRTNLTSPIWHLDLAQYKHLVGSHGIPEADRPQSCPDCKQNRRRPHRHSHYWRTVIELSSHEQIPIFRFRCPLCLYVHSVIPTFLEPYQQMTLDLQEDLMDRIEGGETIAAVAAMTDTLPDEGARTDKTIQRFHQNWCRRLHQLEKGLWSWLLTRVPQLNLPRGASLWASFQQCWEQVRHRFLDFRRIRFLHGLHRLCFSFAVTEHR